MVYSAMIHTGSDPLSEKEALASPEAELWREAMQIELDALASLKCWRYVDASEVPAQEKIYRGKFVLKYKPPQNNMDGRYKARWCISDPKWLQRLTDVDCFSETVRMETIRFLLATAVERNWDMTNIDVVNAFATSRLEKPVYMHVPKMLQHLHPGKVALVEGALCGLAHSPRTFHLHLDKWFKDNGFKPSEADKCLYLKRAADDKLVLAVATFVDDALAAGQSADLERFRKQFGSFFKVRDTGEPKDFTGCEIFRDKSQGVCKFTQTKYIEKMGERYGVSQLTGSGPFSPMEHSIKLIHASEGDTRVDPTSYRSIVGALHYAAHCTRPDIAAAVSILSKFLVDPSTAHMHQAKHCLAYLLATKSIGIEYRRQPPTGPSSAPFSPGVITGFADASFADDVATRRSHTGYVFILNGAAIAWCSRQQDRVANSSTEAEFRSFNSAGREALWLRKLEFDFKSIKEQREPHQPTLIYDDNEACIKWLKNHCLHQKTKHIDTAVLSIREQVMQFKTLQVQPVRTADQVADVLTKILAPRHHWSLAKHMLGVQIPDGWLRQEVSSAGNRVHTAQSADSQVRDTQQFPTPAA